MGRCSRGSYPERSHDVVFLRVLSRLSPSLSAGRAASLRALLRAGRRRGESRVAIPHCSSSLSSACSAPPSMSVESA